MPLVKQILLSPSTGLQLSHTWGMPKTFVLGSRSHTTLQTLRAVFSFHLEDGWFLFVRVGPSETQ
jgi:hypothetical protein